MAEKQPPPKPLGSCLNRLKYLCSAKPDPVRPTKEQLKVLALNNPCHVDTSDLNFYELLKCKFAGRDVDGDDEVRQQYHYYLQVSSGYYADKNRALLEAVGADNKRKLQDMYERIWRLYRLRQTADDDIRPMSSDSEPDEDVTVFSAKARAPAAAAENDTSASDVEPVKVVRATAAAVAVPAVSKPVKVVRATAAASAALAADDDDSLLSDDESVEDAPALAAAPAVGDDSSVSDVEPIRVSPATDDSRQSSPIGDKASKRNSRQSSYELRPRASRRPSHKPVPLESASDDDGSLQDMLPDSAILDTDVGSQFSGAELTDNSQSTSTSNVVVAAQPNEVDDNHNARSSESSSNAGAALNVTSIGPGRAGGSQTESESIPNHSSDELLFPIATSTQTNDQ